MYGNMCRVLALALSLAVLPRVASAVVHLDIPDLHSEGDPVMVRVSTSTNHFHGTTGSRRDPVFVEAGEGVTLQPPFSVPPFYSNIWVRLFHPNYVPLTLTTSSYLAIIGYKSMGDLPFMRLEDLRTHPAMLRGMVSIGLDGGTALVETGTYPGALLEYLDLQGVDDEGIDAYRDYYLRYASLLDELTDAPVAVLCADAETQSREGGSMAEHSLEELVGLCAEPDAAERERLVSAYWSEFMSRFKTNLRPLFERFWQRVGTGPEYDAFTRRYFFGAGDRLQRRPLREVWGEGELGRLRADVLSRGEPVYAKFRTSPRGYRWETDQGMIVYKLSVGDGTSYRQSGVICIGFDYEVDASKYFAADLPATAVKYADQSFCYDPATQSWDWPEESAR